MKIRASISFKLTGFMLAISVLPLLVFLLVSYLAVLQTTVEVATRHNAQLLGIQLDYVNLQTDQIDSLAENPAWLGELTQLQAAASASRGIEASYDDLATKARIGHLLSAYAGLSGLDSIDLYTPQGAHYHLGETQDDPVALGAQLKRLMARALSSPGQTVWYGIEDSANPAASSRKVIVSAKSIYRSAANGSRAESAGILRMNFSTEYLYDHFSALDLGTGGYLLLVDAQQRLLFHPDRGLIGQALAADLVGLLHGLSGSISLRINGKDVLLSYLQIPDKKWYLLSIVPQATLTAPMLGIERTAAVVLLTSLLLIALFIRMYVRQVVQPIRVVSDGFRDFQANRLAPEWRLPKPKAWAQIGELVTWFNSFLDTMQARRQSDADLRESEAKNRALISAIPDTIFTNHRDGTYLAVQVADSSALFVPPDVFLNRTVTDILPREVANQLMNAFAAALDSKLLQEVNYSLQIAGQERYFEVRVVPATGDRVISIVRDITERKRSEETLRIAATAFESQQGMIITNAESVVLRVNQAFTEITGYSAAEAIGQTPRLLSSGRYDAIFYAAMWESIRRTGTWQGEIWNRHKSGEVFPEWLTITSVKDDTGQVSHYVGTFIDISARKAAEDRIKSLAFYDPLTGLPNRRLLMDRLEIAIATNARHQRKGALLFVDLDNVKTLNDTLGHYQGDLLLEQVARRLSACIREGDTAARLGGDEFLVMLEDLSENALEAATQAETVGEKLLVALKHVYQLDNCQYRNTASIGITLFGEDPAENLDEPLKRADLAMYKAKEAGRNTLRFFDPQMQADVSARALLETGLREALETGQLRLYYQAQVTGDDRLTGVEALVRWQHPLSGMLMPAEFIPIAEQTGLILPLGEWVLETACKQLALWAGQAEMAHLTIAVNVSARQSHQSDFVDTTWAVLARSGANPQRLKLELTESLMVDNVESVIEKMRALKAKGVGFSLDDFGTGFSSLSYLKRLPLDQLKIDRGFVRDILLDANDAAIAKMIIALAGSLGLAVIAEGVETVPQKDFLAGQGCHAYQGYLFSRPLPLEEFETLARRSAGPIPMPL